MVAINLLGGRRHAGLWIHLERTVLLRSVQLLAVVKTGIPGLPGGMMSPREDSRDLVDLPGHLGMLRNEMSRGKICLLYTSDAADE